MSRTEGDVSPNTPREFEMRTFRNREVPIARKPRNLYYRVIKVTGEEQFFTFLDWMVSSDVISLKHRDLLRARVNRRRTVEIVEELGYKDISSIGALEREIWGKILKHLSDNGKTLDDIGSLVEDDVKLKKIEKADSRISEVIQELGGVDAIKKRIEEEKKLGGFIKLLAEIMEFVVNHPDMGRDEMNDSLYNDRKAESRERADVLVRNAIDYFLLFPSPDSTPGVESGSEGS